jgi:hypothetical protein
VLGPVWGVAAPSDRVDGHGFTARYASVRRFVRRLHGTIAPEAHPVIVTAPGEEAQVDYGDGAMVRHPGAKTAKLYGLGRGGGPAS